MSIEIGQDEVGDLVETPKLGVCTKRGDFIDNCFAKSGENVLFFRRAGKKAGFDFGLEKFENIVRFND